MTNFDRSLALILKSEGGYSNASTDRGGETYKGISRNRNPQWDGWPLIDAHKGAGFPANLDSDFAIHSSAVAFYRANYWDKCQCDRLDDKLALLLFDSAVNQGVGAAVELLQEAVGTHQDGIIGDQTINAALRNPEAAALFMTARVFRYLDTPTFAKNGKGWIKRLFVTAMEA